MITYNNKKYIIKEIKSRPDEKISYVIASIMATRIIEPIGKRFARKMLHISVFMISIIIPCFLFSEPHMFFEKSGNDYYVRFYTTGITNPETIKVPDTYKNGNVIGIRGNVFSNITSVKEVVLPDTLKIIRGNAFNGDFNLTTIYLPDGLQYIGGGCFKNCRSLRILDIPDSVTQIQGETFMNCTSLQFILLSKNLKEIRGNTFENCKSLLLIEIPEGVIRIGGHAFYGCENLVTVKFPDSIREIGSSAFRLCGKLYEVEIPGNTYINERAFKESPTKIVRR